MKTKTLMNPLGRILIQGAAALLACCPSSWAGTISVLGPSSSPGVGDTFAVDVQAGDLTDLYAFQLDVVFDPNLLAVQSISEGDFLAGGGSTFFLPGIIDNGAGTVAENADSLLGPVSGVSGDGVLLTIEFTALAAGTSAISIDNLILLDSTLTDVSSSANGVGGSVTVGGTATTVPEPGVLGLCVLAVGGMAWRRRKTGLSRIR